MRRLRWATSVIAAVAFLRLYSPSGGLAEDYGPSNATADIRRDVPILLADSLGKRTPPHVDMIYTDGAQAVATWHSGMARGLIVLRFDRNLWWWVAGAATVNDESEYWMPLGFPGREVSECGANVDHSPTVDEMLSKGVITPTFARRLAEHLKVSHPLLARGQPVTSCDYPFYQSANDGYEASWLTPFAGGGVSLNGKAPPHGSMPPVYYTFSLTTHSSIPDAIASGTVLRIWFPFVLDAKKRFVLLLSSRTQHYKETLGRFADNTLAFTLPALTIRADDRIRGVITESSASEP